MFDLALMFFVPLTLLLSALLRLRFLLLLLPDHQPCRTLTATYAIDSQVLQTISSDVDAKPISYRTRVSRFVSLWYTDTSFLLFAKCWVHWAIATYKRENRLREGAVGVCSAHELGDQLRLGLRAVESPVAQKWRLVDPADDFSHVV